MNQLELDVTVVSLCIYLLLGIVTFFFYLISEKTRLNASLATKTLAWQLIVIFIALPAYSGRLDYLIGSGWRMGLWVFLAIAALWVLVEVYLTNRGRIRYHLMMLFRLKKPWVWTEGIDPDRRNYQRRADDRKEAQ